MLFSEILECIVVLKIVYPKTTGAPTKTLSVYVPISSLFTVTGILVGLSGWILNGFYYFNLRNQISSSPLARRSVVSPDSSSCSEISIQSSPFTVPQAYKDLCLNFSAETKIQSKVILKDTFRIIGLTLFYVYNRFCIKKDKNL